jgi:TQXA domain-containing protein/LPXTG-motif cell wall-anchored protein
MSGVAKAADEPATGRALEGPKFGAIFNGRSGTSTQVNVERLRLALNGIDEPVLVYCVGFGRPIDGEKTYTETGWTESTVKGLAKVQWILNHSYPAMSAKDAFDAAGIETGNASDELLGKLAYMATQAAIWSFSDDDKFALGALPDNPDAVEAAAQATGLTVPVYSAAYAVVTRLYEYLTKNAKAEPEPAKLSITPATATGQVGTKVGPFTVNSAVGEVDVTATGTAGTLVDDKGKPVTKVPNKGKFFVDCKADGTVKIDGKVKFNVPLGRVFTVRQAERFQKLILAHHAGREQTASATATCTAKPALPVTGAPVVGTVAAGFVLLGTGAGLFMIRRRRIRFTA